MTMIDEILSQLPAEDLASQLGTDPDTAMDAARKALPALLGGLSSNVSAGGGDALGAALQRDHDGSLLDRADLLGGIDATDGQKILGHIFGDRQDQVVDKLGATSRAGSSLFTKLLPLLAPLVMAWLAKKVGGALSGGGSASQTAQAGQGASGGGGLGGLLGGLFGGGGGESAAATPQQTAQTLGEANAPSGGGLGGLLGGLGGLFGGGQSAAAQQPLGGEPAGASAGGLGGGLGGLLGGLLGREVEEERSAMPDMGDLFDLLGGGSQPSTGDR